MADRNRRAEWNRNFASRNSTNARFNQNRILPLPPAPVFFRGFKRRGGLRPETAPTPRPTVSNKIAVAQTAKRNNLTKGAWRDRAKEDPSKPTEFFDLNTSSRLRIYYLIPTKERVWLQLVCRRMRDEIRTFVGMGTKLDERGVWGASYMRDLLVDTIVVGAYRQPRLKPSEMIHRWYDTQHISFSGPISMPYMDGFLGRCRGVRKISVTHEVSERQPIPTDPVRKRDYKSWRKLDVIRKRSYPLNQCKLLELCPTGRLQHLSVQWSLEVCFCTNIVKLKIEVSALLKVQEARNMHIAILKFVDKHATLEELWVKSKVAKFVRSGKQDFLRPYAEVQRTAINARFRHLSVLEDNVDFLAWPCFLMEQTQLETLQVMHNTPFSPFVYAIKLNEATLSKIALRIMLDYDVHPKHRDIVERSLGLDIFGPCKSLKELHISIEKSLKAKWGVWENRVTDFDGLPKSLEVLALRNVCFLDKQFLKVCRLPKLRSLGAVITLSQGVKAPTFNNKFLGALFRMRHLDELMIQGMAFTFEEPEAMLHFKPYTNHQEIGTKNILHIRGKLNTTDSRPFSRWESTGLTRKIMRYKIEDDHVIYDI